jgi:hypothetical protein
MWSACQAGVVEVGQYSTIRAGGERLEQSVSAARFKGRRCLYLVNVIQETRTAKVRNAWQEVHQTIRIDLFRRRFERPSAARIWKLAAGNISPPQLRGMPVVLKVLRNHGSVLSRTLPQAALHQSGFVQMTAL